MALKRRQENIEIKQKMVSAINLLIDQKELNQPEAAKFLGVSQPRISNLKNGIVEAFSVDMLLKILSQFGYVFEFNYLQVVESEMKITMTFNKDNIQLANMIK